MAWAYVWAMVALALIPSIRRNTRLLVPLVLVLGILPDADLFLESIGIMHRTVTHSFLFWTVVFIPFFVIFRLKSVPYFVAVIQHFAFGDFIMGKVMLLWPFSSKFYGLSFGMPSLVDVFLETLGLVLAFGIMMRKGSLKQLLSIDKRNLFMLVPLFAILVSALFFSSRWSSLNALIADIASNNLLLILAIIHLILLVFLAISSLQGVRALGSNEKLVQKKC